MNINIHIDINMNIDITPPPPPHAGAARRWGPSERAQLLAAGPDAGPGADRG